MISSMNEVYLAIIDLAEEYKKLNKTMSLILDEMIILNDNYAKEFGWRPIPRKNGLTGGEQNV